MFSIFGILRYSGCSFVSRQQDCEKAGAVNGATRAEENLDEGDCKGGAGSRMLDRQLGRLSIVHVRGLNVTEL